MNTSPLDAVFADDLHLGQQLNYDLVDHENQLLCEAGKTVDQHLIDLVDGRPIFSRLDAVGNAVGAESFRDSDVRNELNQLFPREYVQHLQDVMAGALQALSATIESVSNKSNFKPSTIVNSVSQIVLESTRDLQGVLTALTLKQPTSDSGLRSKLLEHATQLSTLGISIACMAGLSQRNIYEIGVAGLLHDLSLMIRANRFDPTQVKTNHELRNEFRKHPLVTVELLKGMPGLSSESLILMKQVHEQCDGSGYPDGLLESNILPGAKILNLADAYLSLIHPLRGQPMVFSDALAYLCYHASRGKFDRIIVKQFVQFMSMYPIGSVVELDDKTAAVVIGNNPLDPLSPKVSLRGKEIDLEKPKRTIQRVSTNGLQKARRVSKQRLNEVFWRMDV